MRFVVEITHVVDDWRLQTDGSWRPLPSGYGRDISLKETDRVFDTIPALQPFQRKNRIAYLGGEAVRVNPTGTRSFGELTFTQFRVFRDRQPPTPSKDEMRQVIRSGNDRHANLLVIDLDGHFKLKPWKGEHDPIHDLDNAVRMETWGGGGGYVGPEAAADSEHIDRVYRDYLAMWNKHLETGEMNLYSDIAPCW